MDVYKFLCISIGTVMKNTEIVKFVLDHLVKKNHLKKMCKHTVKKLPYLLRYVPDQYKTRQMSDKAILEKSRTLTSVIDCYKNLEICNKRIDNYPHALEFVPEFYKTKKMCDKTVNTYTSTIKSICDLRNV